MLRAGTNIVVLAGIGWLGWTLWNWTFTGEEEDEVAAFARRSCIDEAHSRYRISDARAHLVQGNSNGYVVKGSMTLERGGTAQLTCLTNHSGNVTDIRVDEH